MDRRHPRARDGEVSQHPVLPSSVPGPRITVPRTQLRPAPPSPVEFAQHRAPIAKAPITEPVLPAVLLQERLPHVSPAPAPAPALAEHPRVDSQIVTAVPAAVWRRVTAWVTDSVFVVAVVLSFLVLAMSIIAPKNLTLAQQLSAIAAPGVALGVMLAVVYGTLFAVLWDGRTLGRRLAGIHLVDSSGQAPGTMRALARALLSVVSFALFLAGFWLALFDRHGQTLHDKLTRTFVVKLQDT
jgi:uncharacterized RDD family membrane protein YckC